MKLLIAINSVIFIFMGYFVAYLDFPSNYNWISTLFIILISLPSFYYFCIKKGIIKGLNDLFILAFFAVIIEGQAILTGLPYSEFSYSDKIAGKIFDIVPWTIGFAWTPLFLAAIFLTNKFAKNSKTYFIILTSIFLVLFDLVLDPGATSAGLWIWSNSNGFYGVPFQNFIGWFISGILGSIIYIYMNNDSNSTKFNSKILVSTIFTLAFWSGANLYFLNVFPLILGLIITTYLNYLVITFKNN